MIIFKQSEKINSNKLFAQLQPWDHSAPGMALDLRKYLKRHYPVQEKILYM